MAPTKRTKPPPRVSVAVKPVFKPSKLRRPNAMVPKRYGLDDPDKASIAAEAGDSDTEPKPEPKPASGPEAEAKMIPRDVFEMYYAFQHCGGENALMFFVHNPQHEEWGPWIMTHGNYTKALDMYIKPEDRL